MPYFGPNNVELLKLFHKKAEKESMKTMGKWAFLLFVFSLSTACSDGKPNVEFLTAPKTQKTVKPGSPSSVNLSPTTVVSGGSYQLKGRVTYLQTQNEVSGGIYKIKGKVSF